MPAHKKNSLIHFLIGSEDTLKHHYIESILSAFPSLDKELSIFKFDLKSNSLEDIISKAKTFPFLSDVQVLFVSFNKKLTKPDQQVFEDYVNNPASFTIMICDGGENYDFKGLDRKGVTVRFNSDDQTPDLRGIVVQRIKKEEKTISSAALRLFLGRCGDEAERVYSYLDYLVLYCAGKSAITEDDIKAVVSESVSYGSYDLVNALLAKQCDRVLEIFRDATECGMSHQDIMGMVHWQLRRVYEAKMMLVHGSSRADIRKELRIGASFIDNFIYTIQQFELCDIERAVRGLADLDCAIKTGKSDAVLGFERYFLELIG